MRGKINFNGTLAIYRKNEYKNQMCPYSKTEDCGDWCPHFSEPELKLLNIKNAKAKIKICNNNTLYFEMLLDER